MKKFSRKKKLFLLFDFLGIILLILLDQFTKVLAVSHLKDKASYPLVRNVLEFQYLENKGAAFGMLQNQRAFFILIALLIMIVITYVLILVPDDSKYNLLNILLVMIASGAAGNMIDRFRTVYVVDFIYFKLINFPIFNVADIYVTVSTFLLVILFLFYYKEDDFAFLSFKQQKKYRKIK